MIGYFGPNATWLDIKPRSFGRDQRIEAVDRAAERHCGAVMEVGRSSTNFYADMSVPVGHLKIYVQRKYVGFPEYETTLTTPGEEWDL